MSAAFLQALPPLPAAELLPATIYDQGEKHVVPRGEQLGHHGDNISSIFYIRDGLARTFRMAATGERKTLHLIGRGYFIFESYYFSRSPLQIACEAIKDLSLIRFHNASIIKFMQEEPIFAKRLLFSMGLKMQLMGHDLVSLAYEKPCARIKFCLASLAISVGTDWGANNAIVVEITQNQLAELVGLHRVSVTKILNRLQDRAMIAIHRGSLIILPDFFMDDEIKSWNNQGYIFPFA